MLAHEDVGQPMAVLPAELKPLAFELAAVGWAVALLVLGASGWFLLRMQRSSTRPPEPHIPTIGGGADGDPGDGPGQ
jgi:hypothetical protein